VWNPKIHQSPQATTETTHRRATTQKPKTQHNDKIKSLPMQIFPFFSSSVGFLFLDHHGFGFPIFCLLSFRQSYVFPTFFFIFFHKNRFFKFVSKISENNISSCFLFPFLFFWLVHFISFCYFYLAFICFFTTLFKYFSSKRRLKNP